jgi:hypothetical protein
MTDRDRKVRELVEHMERVGGISLDPASPFARPTAFAKLVSIDQRDGFAVLEIASDHVGFDFPSFARHAVGWRPRITTEDGKPAAYVTDAHRDDRNGAVRLDVQVMDANTLGKLAEGVLTGAVVPLRATGMRRGKLTVAPADDRPRFTDRPMNLGDVFCRIDSTGELCKAVKFASAVRGRRRPAVSDPTLDAIKAAPRKFWSV